MVLFLSASILLSLSFNLAHAHWSAINSGYAVTTNWHGKEVPLGQSVTAWAGTTNSSVYQVEFKWKNKTGHVIYDVIVTDIVNYTTPIIRQTPLKKLKNGLQTTQTLQSFTLTTPKSLTPMANGAFKSSFMRRGATSWATEPT